MGGFQISFLQGPKLKQDIFAESIKYFSLFFIAHCVYNVHMILTLVD